MALNQLKEHLLHVIPAELTQIEPGQITYYASKSGITQKIAGDIYFLSVHQDSFYDETTKINIVTTDNPLLIDTIAGRVPQTKGAPYKVIVGTIDCFEEFEDAYFSCNFESLESDASSKREDRKPHPIVVTIDPMDKPESEQRDEPAYFTCPYLNGGDGIGGMRALVAKGNEPTMIELQDKIAALLSNCEKYGYDIDVVRLKNAAKEAYRQAKDYQLELDIQEKTWLSVQKKERVITVCDIYIVGDGIKHKIDIRPSEKALYLTTILQEGFYLSDISFGFLEDMATIFGQMPDRQEKKKGILSRDQSASGVGVMKKNIRDAIGAAIGFGPAVDVFAIEGYRGQLVSVRKANDAHRAQIRKYFGL